MYLEVNSDSFEDQAFHRANAELFRGYEELDKERQQRTYAKQDLQRYLEFCQSKAELVLLNETDQDLAAQSGFHWLDCSRAEVHVYSIRHIQHHAAQISMRLRVNHNIEIPWVKFS